MILDNLLMVTALRTFTLDAQAASDSVAAIEPMVAASLPDWIQAGAAVVTALISLVLLRQLGLLKKQITSAVDWNKLNAAFTYFSSDAVLNREREMRRTLLGININFARQTLPLTEAETQTIHDDATIFGDVKDFLNLAEDYCTAVRIGAIDPDAAYAMMSHMVMKWWRVFSPLIQRDRTHNDDPDLWCELEKVAGDWEKKDADARQAREDAILATQARISGSRGVAKKV